MELSLSTRSQGDHTILSVGGELDLYTKGPLSERLEQLVEQGCSRIVVDMEEVDFLDSSGVGALLGGLKRARLVGGTLTLVCTQPKILKVFRITGLEQIFGIHASVDEALGRMP